MVVHVENITKHQMCDVSIKMVTLYSDATREYELFSSHCNKLAVIQLPFYCTALSGMMIGAFIRFHYGVTIVEAAGNYNRQLVYSNNMHNVIPTLDNKGGADQSTINLANCITQCTCYYNG